MNTAGRGADIAEREVGARGLGRRQDKLADRSVDDVTETILAATCSPARPTEGPADETLPAICASLSRRDHAAPADQSAASLSHTSNTVDPVVLRAARSACALAASFNG